jgi:hypothetical protein
MVGEAVKTFEIAGDQTTKKCIVTYLDKSANSFNSSKLVRKSSYRENKIDVGRPGKFINKYRAG